MPKTPNLTIRLSAQDRAGLEVLAHRMGDVSIAAVVRHLIREALKGDDSHA